MSADKPAVAVLGASANRERYSNKAVRLLVEHGYPVLPVHPALETVEALPVSKSLDALDTAVDTVTVYLSPAISTTLTDQLLSLHPRRVIFNPGAETPVLQELLEEAGISVENACTLVLLNTGQF